MASPHVTVDFFGEDSGHEHFFRALANHLTDASGMRRLDVRTRSSRGGHGKAVQELKGSLRYRLQDPGRVLVVLIDANAKGWAQQRSSIEQVIPQGVYAEVVIGCPEPEIEAWLLADPPALWQALGTRGVDFARSSSTDSKLLLRQVLKDAGVPVLGDPMDIAYEVVPRMDFHRAGKQNRSLKDFVEKLRNALTRSQPS